MPSKKEKLVSLNSIISKYQEVYIKEEMEKNLQK